MQYVVTAMDFTDQEALSRRMENRELHLAGIKKMITECTFLSGGAILDSERRMVGSTVHVAFDTREALDHWISNDPYMLGKVWSQIDIKEIKLVPVDQFK